MVKEIGQHITTSHVLVSQWDGYIINESAWKKEWLDYDYIGAVWSDGVVGNGGFSLRSKRLMDALKDDRFNAPFFPEDEKICRDWRKVLESEFGLKFAPPEVASDFSIEGGRYTNQFGFHSFFTRLPKDTKRPMVFKHSGDQGDIIYSLAAAKAIGGGVFYITPSKWEVRQPPTKENCGNILPLLDCQKYLWASSFTDNGVSHADYDLNKFRETILGHANSGSIFQHHLKSAGVTWPEDKPWLEVDFKIVLPEKPIVISRSLRYHNPEITWASFVKKHGNRMIFIGHDEEHSEFIKSFGYVPKIETRTLLDAARIIAGSKVFIGNQSCPMAIALGLGVNVIQEVWEPDANCILKRKNALYIRGGNIQLPNEWTKSFDK